MKTIAQIAGAGVKKVSSVVQRNVNNKLDYFAISRFHRAFYNSSQTWRANTWLGVPTYKCPLDCWIYQEIVGEVKPDLIIECGTARGGSTLFLASLCDLLGGGEIISVDTWDLPDRPQHPRITYLLGSSTAEAIVEQVKKATPGKSRIMVILDSDHSRQHVARELEIYSELVTKDSYLIVEDSNINNHPVKPDFGPGPMEALHDFLKVNHNFEIDRSRERLLLTFNPDGYLKRIR